MNFGLKEQVVQQIIDQLKKFPAIERAVIYGSRVKGTHREGSDIDLCLFGRGIDQSVLFQIDIALDELMLPYTFDLSAYTSLQKREPLSHIERCGVVFYEKDE